MFTLTCDDAIAIFDQVIHAGPLLDRGKLEGAIAAPASGFGNQEFYPTLDEKVARLIFEVCQAHAFMDGNKRLAWLCGMVVYRSAGVVLSVDQVEAANTVRQVAAGQLTYEQLRDWIIDCRRDLPPLASD
jgi:death-on-curing protein